MYLKSLIIQPGVSKLCLAGQVQRTICFCQFCLLKHRHAHLFTYCLRLLSQYNGRAKWLQHNLYGPQSLKHLLLGFFTDQDCQFLVYTRDDTELIKAICLLTTGQYNQMAFTPFDPSFSSSSCSQSKNGKVHGHFWNTRMRSSFSVPAQITTQTCDSQPLSFESQASLTT